MTPTPQEHEAGLAAFVVREKAARVALLGVPKRRRAFLDALWHFADWDPAVVVSIPASQQTPEGVARLLRAEGCPDPVHIISAQRDLDGRSMTLDEALEKTVARRPGTVISCIPARLAYFEGEQRGDRCVLRRVSTGRGG